MAKNKLIDLNNHLFAQLERLNDEELTDEQIKSEVMRAKAISGISSQIIQNAKVSVEAMKLITDGNLTENELPDMLYSNDKKEVNH